jgi:HPt (histidine-containing phosphotransfer) domain-containing protein
MEMPDIGIRGINPDIALDLLDGDLEIYQSLLQTYIDDTPSVLEDLRNVSPETLADYTMNIHGLKGICAGIGAMAASEKAKKLELMAKAGDLAGILPLNKELIKDIETLMNDIKTWLQGRQ